VRRFDAIHDQAPRALFAACREAGVRRVIQVSALGADAGAASRFHLSKRAADDYLDATMTETSLGRAPRAVATFIAPQEAMLLAHEARLGWLVEILRVSLAVVWIGSGVVSWGLYPVARSLDLLAAVG
jgi:uncharacterized protein YbjT (DUF2867 family)